MRVSTALMHAALAGKDGCLGALLESGADVNRANEEGDTALSLVVLSDSENFIKCFEILISAGADVNMYGKTYQKSPLVIAAKHIHRHYIEGLLEAGADVNSGGYGPLDWAVKSGSAECVKLFLQKGVRAELIQDSIYTAVAGGHADCLKLLIAVGADVDCASEYSSPLMNAAWNGNIGCVSILIDAGADVNYRTMCNSTAIMKAAKNGHGRCVSALLEAGADVNCVNTAGRTALTEASAHGHEEVLNLLIQARADVNFASTTSTALIKAAKNGHKECVNLLIAAGADVNFRSCTSTALMEAATRGQYDCLTLLIAAGADVNSSDMKENKILLSTVSNRIKNVLRTIVGVNVPSNNHVTPLMLAAMFSHNNCVEKLIDAGADVNATTKSGITALMLATTRISESTNFMMKGGKDVIAFGERWCFFPKAPKRSHSECIKMLIREGADVNATNTTGFTPLMAAAYYDNHECSELLVGAGADVNVMKNDGGSALTIAIESEYINCVQALLEIGADVNSSNKKGNTPLMIAAKKGCN